MKAVRTYLRTRLNAFGLEEWKDEKNVENIPKTKLERIFHIELSSGTTVSQNQSDLVVQMSPTVTFFKIGKRNTSENADDIFDNIENMVKEVTQTQYAVTQSQIKIVRLENFTVDSIDISNDNIFIIEVVFYFEYIININS